MYFKRAAALRKERVDQPAVFLLALLEKLFELVFEIRSGDRPFGGVGDGLFAEVVEREGSGRGEATAPGLVQDEPHQLQRHLRVGLTLLQLLPFKYPRFDLF
jgi:hypothetical protein